MLNFLFFFLFFFNDTATTEIYTLSLHDALPIGSRAISDVSGSPATSEGQAGCAPIHISASGCSVGAGRPWMRAIATRELQAYGRICPSRRSTDSQSPTRAGDRSMSGSR